MNPPSDNKLAGKLLRFLVGAAGGAFSTLVAGLFGFIPDEAAFTRAIIAAPLLFGVVAVLRGGKRLENPFQREQL